jgi:hypothetical protein
MFYFPADYVSRRADSSFGEHINADSMKKNYQRKSAVSAGKNQPPE